MTSSANLTLIFTVVMVVALATTYLPARGASRVYSAGALDDAPLSLAHQVHLTTLHVFDRSARTVDIVVSKERA